MLVRPARRIAERQHLGIARVGRILHQAGDARVFRKPRCPQFGQLAVKFFAQRNTAWLRRCLAAFQACQPQPVGEQDVIEGAVDAAEKRRPLLLVLGFRQFAANVVEAPVRPDVVVGERGEMILKARHASSPHGWRRDHSAVVPRGNAYRAIRRGG